MGARGPIARSALRLVTEPDVAGTVAEAVPIKAPKKPEHLDAELSTLWDEIVSELDSAGLIASVDGLAIELALRHYIAARTAHAQLMDAGDVTEFDEKNDRLAKHPADAVFRMQSEMFLKYAQQLGMTFVSRARLALKGDDGNEDNPFAAGAG